MLVHNVRFQLPPRGPHAVEGLSRGRRPGRDDQLDLRMLGLQCGREHLVALHVARPPLLVPTPIIVR